MENEGNRATFWRGAFIGLLAGAVLTILTTPRTGVEMRAAIREKAGKTKDKISGWRCCCGEEAALEEAVEAVMEEVVEAVMDEVEQEEVEEDKAEEL